MNNINCIQGIFFHDFTPRPPFIYVSFSIEPVDFEYVSQIIILGGKKNKCFAQDEMQFHLGKKQDIIHRTV